jgi:hypothetical protein
MQSSSQGRQSGDRSVSMKSTAAPAKLAGRRVPFIVASSLLAVWILFLVAMALYCQW